MQKVVFEGKSGSVTLSRAEASESVVLNRLLTPLTQRTSSPAKCSQSSTVKDYTTVIAEVRKQSLSEAEKEG